MFSGTSKVPPPALLTGKHVLVCENTHPSGWLGWTSPLGYIKWSTAMCVSILDWRTPLARSRGSLSLSWETKLLQSFSPYLLTPLLHFGNSRTKQPVLVLTLIQEVMLLFVRQIWQFEPSSTFLSFHDGQSPPCQLNSTLDKGQGQARGGQSEPQAKARGQGLHLGYVVKAILRHVHTAEGWAPPDRINSRKGTQQDMVSFTLLL